MKTELKSMIARVVGCLLVFSLLLLSVACSGGESDDTRSDTQSTLSDDAGSEATSSVEDEPQDPYPLLSIEDDRITTTETGKTFDDGQITFSFPADWQGTERHLEDGGFYFFRDPALGEKCEFSVYVTGSEYSPKERTEEEYLEYLSGSDRQDVSITTFSKEKVGGYSGTKVVFTYSSEGTEFIGIDYDNVAVGIRLYDFYITYPASESEVYESVFDSILASIEFTPVEY